MQKLTRPAAALVPPLRRLAAALSLCAAGLAAAFGPAGAAAAQSPFAPAILVNDAAITGYELEQRARFLQALNAPGDPAEQARRQLIEERLKLAEARAAGLLPSEEEMAAGIAEFAGRAQLESEEFIAALAAQGVEPETLRAFVRAGLAWRALVRARFGPRAGVSQAEVDRALAGAGGSNVRVLLSEIIIPAPPERAGEVQALARQIAGMTSTAAFSEAARRYSATASREAGGQLPWQDVGNLPPVLRPLVLALAPGEVTDPIPLPNAVALFQLRAIEEAAYRAPEYASIDYATYLIPGGRSETALAQAARIRARADVCDDLYGIARGQPPQVLERHEQAPGEIPADIAIELSKLDPGEISTALTRTDTAGQQVLMLVMLCARTAAGAGETPREEVALGLQNRRLESFAEGYLQQLVANARIIEK